MIYPAAKPSYSRWEWFKFIALRTVFPPVLLWDAVQFCVNKLFGRLVGKLVLLAAANPAVKSLSESGIIGPDVDENVYYENIAYRQHTVITHDHARLDTLEMAHESQKNLESKYKKYLIHFVGNNGCYESDLASCTEDAYELSSNVIGFNLRGVGRSTGVATSKNDLITDGIAQVQRLLDQGVSPQNITLKGHSLGGAIAALVAQHFHKIGVPLNVFSSRSFSNITNFLIGHVRLKRDQDGKSVGHQESTFKKILGWVLLPIVKVVVALTNWELNGGAAFKSIPENYRDYIVVRSRKSVRENRYDDNIIPHYASIHMDLATERRAKKANIDRLLENIDATPPDPVMHAKLVDIKHELLEVRREIKSRNKMEPMPAKSTKGHILPASDLYNHISDLDAHAFFKSFVRRAAADHAIAPPNLLA